MSVYPIRHGETEWSLNGRHTGVTDLPLTANGRRLAAALKPVLARQTFALVLTSPMQRARETCELAGLGGQAIVEPGLMEWNYGDYEGLTTAQIQAQRPGWLIFRDGCPHGETPAEVAARADRVIDRARRADGGPAGGDAALFGHGHILRVLAARWIGLPPEGGAHFLLGTGTLCVLGQYRDGPAIDVWNGPLGI